MGNNGDLKEMWNNGGRDIAIGVLGLGLLLVNGRVSKAHDRINGVVKTYNKNFSAIDEVLDGLFKFKSDSFDNFDLIAKDINRIATSTGYKGKLGVNS